MEGLKPSYKTIANFRKDNAKALQKVNKDFVVLCKELELFAGELAGIDGSFFRASASKASIQRKEQLKKEIERIEKEIENYQQALNDRDQEDACQGVGSLVEDAELSEKLEALKSRQADGQALLENMEAQGETQHSRTDKDARLLSKSGQKVAGYNVQTSVDSQHKLIISHEVTNDGNDTRQLLPMAKQTLDTLESETLTVVADSGYYNQIQIRDCIAEGITPYVAIPDKSKAIQSQGRFTREQFKFNVEQNQYLCPANQILKQIGNPYQKGDKTMRRYASTGNVCGQCELKGQCLPEKGKIRQLNRWEDEHIVEEHKERMKAKGKEMMRLRSGIAEHPFGTLKRWFGWDHFLVRGFTKVRGEMSIMVLGYNLLRVFNIIGIKKFRGYCALRKELTETSTEYSIAA